MTTSSAITLLPGRTGLRRRPRLVAIDIDNTLLRTDKSLADATIDAVRRARDAGIAVTLASSRPPGGMRPYLEALGLAAPAAFVGFQGALVAGYDTEGGLDVYATSPLDLDDARAAAAAARSVSLATNWYTSDGWYVDALTAPVAAEARIVRMQPEVVEDLSTLPAPVKLLFIEDAPGRIEALLPFLPASVEAETSNPGYLEITAVGVDKATGVRLAASREGVQLADVVAIGDGRNDLGLFRRVGASIAPANADPSVLAEADYLTASNDDDGVALALDWLSGLPR